MRPLRRRLRESDHCLVRFEIKNTEYLEEDVLGNYSPSVRGKREVTVMFGEPVPVEAGRKNRKEAAILLTKTLEDRVQAMLDTMA